MVFNDAYNDAMDSLVYASLSKLNTLILSMDLSNTYPSVPITISDCVSTKREPLQICSIFSMKCDKNVCFDVLKKLVRMYT